MGLVPNVLFLALVGVTRGDVFVAANPINPCFSAISVYHWQIPKWFEPLAHTQPSPLEDLALEMARFMLKKVRKNSVNKYVAVCNVTLIDLDLMN